MSNLERIDYNGINVFYDSELNDIYWTVEDVAKYLEVSKDSIYKIIQRAKTLSNVINGFTGKDMGEKGLVDSESKAYYNTVFYNLETLTWILTKTSSDKAVGFQLWANKLVTQKLKELAGLSNPYHDPILEWDDAKLKLPGHKGEHLSEVQKRTLDYSKVLYPNKGKPWTIKEHDRIILMLKEKVDLIEIANQLDRTPRSLSQHINTYKLDELAKNQLTLFDIAWNGDDEDD